MTYDAVHEQLQLLPEYLGHHLLLTLLALLVGVLVCVPFGLVVTRIKVLQWPLLTAAGVLQTIPGLALLALMVPLLGTIGFVPALLALILYSFLPILRNTVTGVMGVDGAITEAARSIGMTDRQSLFNVELPLALPVIIAGIRTAAVWVVGTATLATPVGATSLGNYVFSGLQTQNITAILVGCAAAALLAIGLDQMIRLIELAVVRRQKLYGLAAAALLMIMMGLALAPWIGGRSVGKSIVIGSKPFTEQYVLAEMIADRIERAGFDPDVRPGMGSIILFEALANGSVDCYVDYSGTIWTNVMKRTDLPTRAEIIEEMTTWLYDKHGVVCLGALGFENTYALAVTSQLADEHGLRAIDDLTTLSPSLSMGSDYEFFQRPEWAALESSYGLEFERLVTLDPSLMYSAVTQDEVDVISAYSTDGRIAAYNLVVLDDSKQALPPYDAVLLLSAQAAERTELVENLRELVGGISGELMRDANKLVDVDRMSVDSAAQYLETAQEAVRR